MRVVGIDPGTSSPGLALVERTPKAWALLQSPVLASLEELVDALVELYPQEVNCVCCEDVSWVEATEETQKGFGSSDIKLAVGAAKQFAALKRVPFVLVRPQTWQAHFRVSGAGAKTRAREMLRRTCSGVPKVFGMNRSDAACIAIAGAGRARVAS